MKRSQSLKTTHRRRRRNGDASLACPNSKNPHSNCRLAQLATIYLLQTTLTFLPAAKTSTRPPFRLSLNLPPPSAQLPPRITLAHLLSRMQRPEAMHITTDPEHLALTFRVSNCAHRPTSNSLPLRTPSSLPIPLSVRCSSRRPCGNPRRMSILLFNVSLNKLQRMSRAELLHLTTRPLITVQSPSLFLPLEAPLHFTSTLPRLRSHPQ